MGPTNGHRHLLSGVFVSNHAVERYQERRKWLGSKDPNGSLDALFTDRQQIGMYLMLVTPCYGIPEVLVRRRAEKYGRTVSYWHYGPWRFVIGLDSILYTVEPDTHHNDLGLWRTVEEAVHLMELHGFTVEEITGGSIKPAHH